MPSATITLSLLAHAGALLALVLLVPSQTEPPAMPVEPSVTLIFETPPAILLPKSTSRRCHRHDNRQ
jgi:hypothetical protein